MDYFEWILEKEGVFLQAILFQRLISSISAAISSLDYLNEVNWYNYAKGKKLVCCNKK